MIDASARMKAWRAKRALEDPEFVAKELEKARIRSRAKWDASKDDPAYIEAERTRKRETATKARKDPVKNARIKANNKRSRAKSENRVKAAARMAAWKEENAESVAEYARGWRDANAEHRRDYHEAYNAAYRFEKYGITIYDFIEMLVAQEGKCDICEVTLQVSKGSGATAHIDHNHVTGEVRGLLCMLCNQGLGLFRDNPELLINAAAYLDDKGHYG
jgi:hypothetical protein